MSTERVIVQSAISTPLIKALTSLAGKLRPTPSSSSDTSAATPHLPPLTSRIFIDPLYNMIKDATSRGAQLLLGDLKLPPPNSSAVQPHILLGVEPGWPIWEQESFGPVFGIKIVPDGEIGEEEAVELANKSNYSLMGAVWTEDWKKGINLGRRIRAGMFRTLLFLVVFIFFVIIYRIRAHQWSNFRKRAWAGYSWSWVRITFTVYFSLSPIFCFHV